MTVSTINGATTELRRIQDNQNKADQPLPYQPSAARLPEDVLQTPPVQAGPDLAAAVQLTEAQNRDAAQSTLSDFDLDALVAEQPSPREQVAREPQNSVAAQAARLPANVLDLLAE